MRNFAVRYIILIGINTLLLFSIKRWQRHGMLVNGNHILLVRIMVKIIVNEFKVDRSHWLVRWYRRFLSLFWDYDRLRIAGKQLELGRKYWLKLTLKERSWDLHRRIGYRRGRVVLLLFALILAYSLYDVTGKFSWILMLLWQHRQIFRSVTLGKLHLREEQLRFCYR